MISLKNPKFLALIRVRKTRDFRIPLPPDNLSIYYTPAVQAMSSNASVSINTHDCKAALAAIKVNDTKLLGSFIYQDSHRKETFKAYNGVN